MSNEDRDLEALLEFLRETRGLDFTGYKRASLERRIRKRLDAVDVSSFQAYQDFLEANPDEQSLLVDTILINVTSFFRDTPAWTYLAEETIPTVISAKDPNEPIRVWSAGCASGEEAYSLAMVFADHLGLDAFKARVKIFATDVDEAALAQGRAAIYGAKQLQPVGDERLEKYFEPVEAGYRFRADCRRSVIFGRNDITSDAPISRLDLLVSRNVLMYFTSPTQRQVLRRFHYALADDGHLFLGKAETIFAHSDLFVPVNTSYRVFARAPGPPRREQLALVGTEPNQGTGSSSGLLSDLAAAAAPVARLIVDIDGQLVETNPKAQAMLGLTSGDIGRPLADLEVSHHPIQLRPQIERAYADSAPVVVRDVERTLADGQTQHLEVRIAPLSDSSGVNLGVVVSYTDVTELASVRADLETAANELATSNSDLHTANEELETSNEELQSTNEELETTNEELQSANEELETMNEELQSGNEELATMNEQLLSQTGRIEQGERFLDSILNSLVVGIAVIDPNLDVMVWNRAAEDLFGLRAEEATRRSFLALDIGLPVGEVGPMLHELLATNPTDPVDVKEIVLDAVDRRGLPMKCRVSAQRLRDETGANHNLVVHIDPLPDGTV